MVVTGPDPLHRYAESPLGVERVTEGCASVEPALSYRLLGPLEVRRGDQHVVVSAGKQRTLLVSLLVSANRLVSVDELCERLWGNAAPATARATLATYVMRLRRNLGQGIDPGADVPIRTRPEGYLIEVEPGRIDLDRFTDLLAQADRHPGDVATARALLREALELWRGPALVDIPSESLHRDLVPRLEEQRRLLTVERRIDAELILGEHAELVGELTALTMEHPLRERFWYQLMLALYSSHRQSDALDAYGRLRTLLVDEMGLEPSPEIRLLHQRILAEDPSLHQAAAGTAPGAAPASWVSLCQLPPDIADFVGRADLLEALEERLRTGSDRTTVLVLSLTGPPGTGKSTVAVRAAHRLRTRFPDGQLFVRLTGANGVPRDPAEVLGELLTASGVGRDALPDGVDARASAFRARLADRAVLLLLDDAASARQVLPLVPGTPGSVVLVTGRRLLGGVPGGHAFRLGSLTEEDSLDLLATLVGTDRVNAEPAAARAIVAACGGLPLALRIVGARLAARPSTGLAGLAERLADEQRRLDELRTTDLEVRAGLALSYSALSPVGATAFRRLGLLGTTGVAAWTLGVLADQPDGERLAEELVEASLLTETGRDPTGEPRYRAHDLLAVYAAELARADDPTANEAALRRLVDTFLALADAAHRSLATVSFDEAPVDPIRPAPYLPERDVTRLTADGEAWMLAEQLQLGWVIRRCAQVGWYADAAHLAERVLARLDVQLPHTEVLELWVLIRAAASEAGDERVAWRSAWQHAMQAATRGLTDDVLTTLAESAAVFERLDAPLDLAYSLAALAHFRDERQQGGEALALAERAAAAARASGYRPAYASAVREFASLLAQHGRYAEAIPLFDETLDLARELGGPVDEALVLHRITRYALENGDLDRAAEASRASLAVIEGVHELRARAYVTAMAARVASARGEGAEAVELAGRAHAALASLAEAYLEVGRVADVIGLVKATLPAYADVGAARHEQRLRDALAAAEAGPAGVSETSSR
nr:BTAD domain-containing putative transcriptional regulator [Actinopolymorpha pittospori]